MKMKVKSLILVVLVLLVPYSSFAIDYYDAYYGKYSETLTGNVGAGTSIAVSDGNAVANQLANYAFQIVNPSSNVTVEAYSDYYYRTAYVYGCYGGTWYVKGNTSQSSTSGLPDIVAGDLGGKSFTTGTSNPSGACPDPPPPPCEDEINEAIEICGDIESIQWAGPEECDYGCNCSVTGGTDRADAVIACGGEDMLQAYNMWSCTYLCNDVPCQQQAFDLTQECGVNSWHWTDEENCVGECSQCEDLVDACIEHCGGEIYVAYFDCAEGEDQTNNDTCVCDDYVDPPTNDNPEGFPIPDISDTDNTLDVQTSTTENADGTSEKTVVTIVTNPNGQTTTVTTTKTYDDQGVETGTTTTTEEGVIDPDEPERPGEGFEVGESSCPSGEVCIGDGVCQEGEPEYSVDCSGANYYETRWTEFKTNMMATDLFGTIDGIATLPEGGNSTQSIDMGELGGVQLFDWSEFDYVWSILATVFVLAFTWIGIKIVVLKKD